MRNYKLAKGLGVLRLFGTMIVYDMLIAIIIYFVNSYIVSSLLELFLIIFNSYMIYYISSLATLKYGIDNDFIYITNLFRKIRIPAEQIERYQVLNERINGIKLSGFCTNSFAIGKSFVKNIGTTNMYVTTERNIFYLNCGDISYALSPDDSTDFETKLREKKITAEKWDYSWNKNVSLHRDKSFMLPFFLVTIINIILTLNPFVLYLMHKLPDTMPLSFDSSFLPLELGSGKQFAFNQMVYGVLNMAIQFCMYYASHFYAKYDRRSVNKFIYVALIISLAFLLIQFRILHTFK